MQGMLSRAQQGAGSPTPQRNIPATPPTAQPQQQSQQPAQNSDQQNPAQEMYNIVVGQAAEWIYGEGLQSVQQRLQVSEDPAQDIGDVVGNVLLMELQSAKEAGKSIPVEVMVQAAMELSALVAELSAQLGRMSEQEINREAVEGFYESMTKLGQSAQQLLSPEETQQYQQMIQQVIAAEEQHLASLEQQSPSSQPQQQPPQQPTQTRGASPQPQAGMVQPQRQRFQG